KSGQMAPIDQQDERGWTPLASACNEKQYESIRILLKYGASASLANFDGNSPLHLLDAQVPTEKDRKTYKKAFRLLLANNSLTPVHDLEQRQVKTKQNNPILSVFN